jgi:hypothetical protein
MTMNKERSKRSLFKKAGTFDDLQSEVDFDLASPVTDHGRVDTLI